MINNIKLGSNTPKIAIGEKECFRAYLNNETIYDKTMQDYINEHMIALYSPAKQGATNKSLESFPRLYNLSNSRVDFSWFTPNNDYCSLIDNYNITINAANNPDEVLALRTDRYVPSFYVGTQYSNINTELIYRFYNKNGVLNNIVINSSGYTKLPANYGNKGTESGFIFSNFSGNMSIKTGDCPLQLHNFNFNEYSGAEVEAFPNSLVFNGVAPTYVYNKNNITTYGAGHNLENIVKWINNNVVFIDTGYDQINTSNPFLKSTTIYGNEGQTLSVNIKSFKIRIKDLPDDYKLSIGVTGNNIWSGVYTSFSNGIHIIPSYSNTITPTDGKIAYFYHWIRVFKNDGTAITPNDNLDFTIEFLPNYGDNTTRMYGDIPNIPLNTVKCMMMDFVPFADKLDSWYYCQRPAGISGSDFAIINVSASSSNHDQSKIIAYRERNNRGTYINGSLNTDKTVLDLLQQRQVVSVNQKVPNYAQIILGHETSNNGNYVPQMALYSLMLFDVELTEEQMKWVIDNMLTVRNKDIVSYGVEWDITNSSPILKRIGNMQMHRTLPIQSKMRGCVAQGNQIMYYLNENDWFYKENDEYVNCTLLVNQDEDGQTWYSIDSTEDLTQYMHIHQNIEIDGSRFKVTSVTRNTDNYSVAIIEPIYLNESGVLITNTNYDVLIGSNLSGYDGTVKVHTPKFYGRSWEDGNKRSVRISEIQVDETWDEIPSMLIDAYKCTILREVPSDMGYLSTLSVNSTVSIVNSSTYCRGGNNNRYQDEYLLTDPMRTQLNKPVTNVQRSIMRTNARKVGAELLSYEQYKWIFYWLYVIEYANFNSQAAYNSTLTSDGFRQGGLGLGVTTLNYSNLALYNYVMPLIENGFGNSIGNHTGLLQIQEKNLNVDSHTYSYMTQYTRDSSVFTTATSGTSIIITESKKANGIGISASWYYACGLHVYSVSGLEEGQELQFVSNNVIIATVDSSSQGLVEVNWGTSRYNREIRANFTGTCNITLSVESTSVVKVPINIPLLNVPRWRGFDNPFGDIWTALDGILIDTPINSNSNILPTCYIINDASNYTDNLNELSGKISRIFKQPRLSRYIKDRHIGNHADIIPKETGGNGDTYSCDQYNVSYTGTPKISLMGSTALIDKQGGLGAYDSQLRLDIANTTVGFRTVHVISD